MKSSLACVVLCSLVAAVCAFKSGAPQRQCEAMRPYHEGSEPQTGRAPYTVSFSKSKIAPGERISVKITGEGNEKLKGFMIQARVGDTPVGKFSSSNSIKLLDCSGTSNTATHTSNTPRSRVNLFWTAPKDLTETVTFKYTIVKDYVTYWVALDSPKLTIA
nr:PREDICTED: putative defense protein 3 [Bemisia tabaci]